MEKMELEAAYCHVDAGPLCWRPILSLSVVVIGLCLLCYALIRLGSLMWVKPRRIQARLSKQGVGGPRPSFFYGNIPEMNNIQSIVTIAAQSSQHSHLQKSVSHQDWTFSIFPYLQQWSKQYGSIYMYSTGSKKHLYVGLPEIIKELNLHKTTNLGKPSYLSSLMEPLLGEGIIKANGPHWVHQRKLIAPEFFPHKVKHMLGLVEESTIALITRWESQVEAEGGVADVTVDPDLKSLSADIISKACFGSSYSQGKDIFAKVEALQQALSKQSLLFKFANFRFLPTKSNRHMWRLKKEVESLILKVVRSRQKEDQNLRTQDETQTRDLLQTILENAATTMHHADADRFLVDICKNIYFAGHETTALAASWCLMLLALHPEWQERVHAEIADLCGTGDQSLHDCLLDFNKLRQLRQLTMVIQESLRLYGPAVITSREAFADIRLGDLVVPKGAHIWLLITALHRDPENWGPDANEFKPERFAGGISEACKHPEVYTPFGFGTRLCLGRNFAMMELKVALALIVSNFSFSLSPLYRHSPVYKMLLAPQYGVRLLLRRRGEGGTAMANNK